MTVAELINELQTMPQNALVYAEGELADKVILENCEGNEYVRIFKTWDCDMVVSLATKWCDRNVCIQNEYNGIGCDECIYNPIESEDD